MPFSGSAPNKTFSRDTGVYTGATAWQQTSAASRGIRADDADTHDQDMAAAIDTSLQKNGDNKPSADIDWGTYGLKNLGYLGSATEASVASSGTTDVLGASALFVSVTGTTTITSLGTGTNRMKLVRFTGALTLTHHATSLILPGGANITTAAGDTMVVVSDASSNARVLAYQKASGEPLAYSAALTALVAAFTAASASGAASLALAEDTDNGSHKATVIAPASLAADATITLPNATATLATVALAETFTNKRITKRVVTNADQATLTIDSDSYDVAQQTAQAQALTIAAPTGTPTNHQPLVIRLKDNGTARALTWNAAFRAVGVTLPTTTVLSKTTYVGCFWNSADSKWDAVAVATEA